MKLLFTTILLCIITTIHAQYTVAGSVSSEIGSLIGAEVILYQMGTDVNYGTTTELDGTFEIKNVASGKYRLVCKYLGFKDHRERLTVESDMALDLISLQEDAIEIDGIEITGTMIQAIQSGDTTRFNAAAFQTLPDADAKELIAKIPGIQIENGVVKANGENVTRVTVDGKEFFGDDPNVALNALPAEVIDKIEIIDQQSEQSQFTGFDDGNTTKTINIVTKPDMRKGEFGKIYLGYGQNDRYQSGGNINIFNGDQRTSIIGLSNNINQQNFSSDDLLGVLESGGNRRGGRRGGGGRGGSDDFLVGQSNGIATTNSIGINFSDKWGEKINFSGSYFFNTADNTLVQMLEQEYFSEDIDGDLYTETIDQNTENTNHRAQARIDIKFDDKNTLRIRPQVSWQGNQSVENSDTEFLRLGSMSDEANNMTNADRSSLNLSNNFRYQHAFAKKGRSLSLSFDNTYRPSQGTSSLITDLSRDSLLANGGQYSRSTGTDLGYGAEVGWTEPFGARSQIMVDYEFEKDHGEDLETTIFGAAPDSGIRIDQLSNDQMTDETTNTVSAGYQWRKERTMIMARARVEHTNISSDQVLPLVSVSDQSYLNFLPFIMARLELSEDQNLRIYYRPRTDNPSASQLSETVDNSNPLQLTKGNVNIKQGYQHSLFARYSATDKARGTVLYVFGGADYATSYIGDRTYLNGDGVALYDELGIDNRAQLTLPDNLSGYYNLRSYVTIGLPFSALKSKLNFNINGNYTNTPSIVNDQQNDIRNATLGFGAGLTSNISQNVDFTISSNTNLGDAKNTLQPDQDVSYLNQNTSLKLDVIFPYGITWRSQINHQIFRGYGDDFDDSYLLGIMSFGKKFLKNDRAEISLSVFDLFNQNQAISRTVFSTYTESTISNVLQRYLMVNFKYDLRHFGSAPPTRESGDRRHGPPNRGGERRG